MSSFLTAVGALFGVVALWGRWEKLTQRRRDRRDGAKSDREGIEEKTETTRRVVWPLVVFPLIFPCLYYVTHADLRYRHPIDPIVLLLTAIAIANAAGFAVAKFGGTEY